MDEMKNKGLNSNEKNNKNTTERKSKISIEDFKIEEVSSMPMALRQMDNAPY